MIIIGVLICTNSIHLQVIEVLVQEMTVKTYYAYSSMVGHFFGRMSISLDVCFNQFVNFRWIDFASYTSTNLMMKRRLIKL